MLTIRESQVEALLHTQLRQFVGKMMLHLRAHFPSELEKTPEWVLGEQIEACLVRAQQRYAVTSHRDCARFLGLAVCFGWAFDTQLDWPATWLQDPSMRPSDRLARVHARLQQQLDQEAKTLALKRKLGI